MDYSDHILYDSITLRELNSTALATSRGLDHPYVEGNSLYEHPLLDVNAPLATAFFEKRFNLFQLAQKAKTVLEIGFNAGHSALLMLLANRSIEKITLFDLNFHSYTSPCFDYLKNKFPQIEMVYGNSYETLPTFISQNPTTKFDLIHIDGSHELIYAESDFLNCKNLSHTESVVIFDDTSPGTHLRNFIDDKIRQQSIKFVDRKEQRLKLTPDHEIFHYIN